MFSIVSRFAQTFLLLGIFLFVAAFHSHAQRVRTTNVITSTNTNTTTKVTSNK